MSSKNALAGRVRITPAPLAIKEKAETNPSNPFYPGHKKMGGRKKGQRNKLTTLIKDAIVKAAELEGQDGKGKDGMVGYMRKLARNEPKTFAGLLGRALPFHLISHQTNDADRFESKEELLEELERRGLPIKLLR